MPRERRTTPRRVRPTRRPRRTRRRGDVRRGDEQPAHVQPVSLRPDEEVRFEVDTESVNDDISDAAAIKRARETQGGLPGTREWYSNTLPWYTKMYPASEFEDSATSASADGSGSSPATYESPTYESPTYESPTYEYESPTYESPTYESPTYESPTYESPYAPTENGASSSYANGIADVSANGSFSSSREARIIDEWSKSSDPGTSTNGYGVPDGFRAARVRIRRAERV